MNVIKQLVVTGVVGLIIGASVYLFIMIQRRLESRNINKWEESHANISLSDLEEARRKKFGSRIFPGVSNKFIFALIFVFLLVFALAELGLLQ